MRLIEARIGKYVIWQSECDNTIDVWACKIIKENDEVGRQYKPLFHSYLLVPKSHDSLKEMLYNYIKKYNLMEDE